MMTWHDFGIPAAITVSKPPDQDFFTVSKGGQDKNVTCSLDTLYFINLELLHPNPSKRPDAPLAPELRRKEISRLGPTTDIKSTTSVASYPGTQQSAKDFEQLTAELALQFTHGRRAA